MIWKCPPLNLFNWSNSWKWKEDMPYIKQEDREALGFRPPQNAGELNYALTRMVQIYLYGDSNRDYQTNYQRFNDAIGALEGCKLELYRRLVAPYEDAKIEENGDVYK